MAKGSVSVTIDDEREVAAVNAWFQRWGPKLALSDNQGCGCCVDIWDVEAPTEAFADLLPRMVVMSAAD
jgi:hypothetical protein